jgi:Ca2+-binding RTX toxin-like protein
MQTRIFGGLGSDRISVGTAAPIVVADDLQGHSGIIENSVETTVGNWIGIPVDGVATSITDNDAPAADIEQTGGSTVVYERGSTTDTFTIRLSKVPSSPVMLTISAPYPSPDQLAAHAQTVLVSLDGIHWSASVTVVLSGSQMSQQVYVKAIDDAAAEGEQQVALQLLVVQTGGSKEYDGLVLPNVYVRVIDDDQPGITVVTNGHVQVTEGGRGASYTVGLAKQPTGTVHVTVDPGAGMQVSTNGTTWSATVTLTFTSSDWAARTVYVRAIDDHLVEGTQYATVTATVTATDDPSYTGLRGDDVSVLVYDADSPGVEILESDGGTHVTEGGGTDSYQVRLTSNPCPTGSCTVTIRSTAVPTPTLNGDVAHDDVQVLVSTDGKNWSTSVELTFTGDNWDAYQTVWVMAVDDSYADGSDYQAFAQTDAHRVFQIQGPLYVYGGENPDANYEIPAPVMLPGEDSGPLVTTPNPNFDADETKQVDTLVVDNSGSVADDTGTLTSSQVTGLGMGGPQSVDGRDLNGGITYADLEDLQILLGSGNDHFTVAATHDARTEISGGDGNDAFTVDTLDGHTYIDGGAGDDSFAIGSGGLVSGLTGLLAIDGGDGSDTATIDDSSATADELATITQHTVSGMEMVARPGIDRVYLLTVHATTGTFTITLGSRTATFAVGATADQIQAGLQALLFPNPRSCGLPGGSTPGQDTRCATSVYVWQQGSSYLIGLTGEVAGLDAPALTSSQTDLQLLDGIAYWGLEDLHLTTGSGNDGVNIRGTTAHTTVATGAGDDLVFVSDAADLGNLPDRLDALDLSHLAAALQASGGDVAALLAAILNGTLTIDDQTFHGSLDLVTGLLDIDAGAGSNTVAVSDRGDTDPDANVVVTDHGVTGLAPAPISWTATGGDLAGQGSWTTRADSGLFGHGVMVMLGSGGNTGTITSVRGGANVGDPFGGTVTTIWTGEGNDAFTITANAPAGAARLVVLGQGGDDSLTALPTATQPLVLFGGAGADTLTGGAGNDTIFGDDGRVYYLAPSGAAGFDIVLGGAPVAGHLTDPRTGSRVAADAVFLTPDVVRTADTSIGTGDTLQGAGGNDVLLGGRGSDTISGGTDNDLAFGDYAWIGANAGGFVDQTMLPMSMALATHPFGFVSIDTTDGNGAADTINGDDGNDILLGQQGGDTINGGNGDDDVIGGHNVAGGNDGADTITGGAGNDVLLGDNGTVLRTGSKVSTLIRVLVGTRLYLLDPTTGTFYGGNTVDGTAQVNPTGVETRAITILDHTTSTPRSSYGSDTISADDGNDLVFGELGDDVIRAGYGDDYVEGNGGNDTIYGGVGQDDLIGGSSDLFGLVTRAQRPDGSDLVYGGDGTGAARNDAGDTTANGHANDADVLIGDNGDVFRIVGTGGTVAKGGGFLTFTYDNYGTLKLIPRVVELLDYSPTGGAGYWDASADPAHPVWMKGTGTNIGAGDFLHGEGGDDTIHGMTGDDAIFGDGQDDDLYGEAGQDWISGGAGTDGILGDDGLLITSRNGQTEPLEGVTTANKQASIRGSGPQFSATVYTRGQLNKAADLEPFTTGYDDVIYGGLGDDFIHGGLGDDAISGGEALPVYYTDDPLATLAQYYVDNNPLQWGVGGSDEKFLYYNPNNPRQLVTVCPIGGDGHTGCLPFLTTNDPTEADGNDAIFGDGGNDWLSGGTGADHMYGGWGYDLLNADDDVTTDPTNANPDTAPAGQSNADYAFGGAGYDVLIGNTQDDRLIDWLGEFNSYIVPFNPFGSGAVWRAADPGTVRFLYQLSAGDGTDLTRGGDTSRNSEPNGELGLVLSSDPAWGDQSAQPQDPQPGNGGSVNTSTSTTYSLTSASAVSGDAIATDPADVGGAVTATWVQGSNLAVTVAPTTTGSTPIVVTVDVEAADGSSLTSTQISLLPGTTTGAVVISAADLGLPGGTLFTQEWVPVDDPAGSTYRLVLRALA